MIRAILTFELEYDEGEIEGDPRELLLEILAAEKDEYLSSLITVETIKE